ncbi:glycosyltransferase family 4 protein [Spirosoma oryzicola]|uniref:glycosyltransferase family 4 protein n=1 Tax=Spirosoma oryzicola TaxID=2898794 RepID=UPI001E2C5402|nr:glycosyltransferase family 1 protein [Spirosoma oryzicola]UHG91713.1 glycosyltransferase family 4 protein [Spirosoma oryzicola]
MNIFFDYQTFSLQTFGGISRYYAELIKGINETRNNNAYLPLLFSNNVHLQESGLGVRQMMPNKDFYKKIQIIYRSNQLYTIAKLYQKQFDIFHATYYDPYFIPHLKGRPFVVTFLDMIHEKFVAKFPGLDDGGVIFKQKKIIAGKADKIIAISESTKRDVVSLLEVDPDKVKVIYLGSSLKPSRIETIDEQLALEPYLLFVGRRERYKNFDGLLSAVYPLLKKYKLKLLCAGGGQFTNEERFFINSLGASSFVQQCSIDDQKLQQLYQGAVAFVFPSMYEGFGIPVLEAFACGCPCIVSNNSSLPEVAGKAAIYIDPLLPETIVSAVEKVITDTYLRQEMIDKGYEQLSLFSWENTVSDTLDLYRAIA